MLDEKSWQKLERKVYCWLFIVIGVMVTAVCGAFCLWAAAFFLGENREPLMAVLAAALLIYLFVGLYRLARKLLSSLPGSLAVEGVACLLAVLGAVLL